MKPEFVSRGKRMDTETAERLVWKSTCGRYMIAKIVSKFSLPVVFHAIYIDDDGQQAMLHNRSRTKDGAIGRCEQHAKALEAAAVSIKTKKKKEVMK